MNYGKVKIELGSAVQRARVPARAINPMDFPIIVQWRRGERKEGSKAPVGNVLVGTPVGTVQLSFFENNGSYSLSRSLSYTKMLLPEDLQTNILEEIERQARGEIEFTVTGYKYSALENGGGILGRLTLNTKEYGSLYGVLVCKTHDGRIYVKEPTNYFKDAATVEVAENETYYPSFEIGSITRTGGKVMVNQTKNPSGGVTLSKGASMAILEIAKQIVSGELPADPTVSAPSAAQVATEAAEVEQEDLEAVRV